MTCNEATFEPKCKFKCKCDGPCKIPHCDMEIGGRVHMHADGLQHWQCVHTIERVLQRRPLPRGNNMTKDQRMPPDAHQVLYSASAKAALALIRISRARLCQNRNNNASFVSDCVKRGATRAKSTSARDVDGEPACKKSAVK